MMGIFKGHMANRKYWGIYVGRWGLVTLWSNPPAVQGPARFFLVRD